MIRLLLAFTIFSLLAPAAGWAADCSQSGLQMEAPTVAKNQVTQNCNGSTLCQDTYNGMWKQYEQTTANYDSACGSIQNVVTANPGMSPDKLGPLMTAQTSASVTTLDTNDQANQKTMQSYRDKLLVEVQKEAVDPNTDGTTKTQINQLSTFLKGHDSLSTAQLNTFIGDTNKSSVTTVNKANLVAAARSMRFKTSITEQTTSEKARLKEVAASQATMTDNLNNLNTPGGGAPPPNSNVSKGDSGFGMSDAMKYAPLATAGLGVMAMMQNQSSASAGTSAAATDSGAAASSTQAAALPTATNMGSTNPGSSSSPSFNEGTSASSTPNKTAANTAGTANAAASNTPEALRALASNGQFSGSLGGSPFSGSSSSSPGVGLGSSADTKANSDASPDAKKSADAGFVVPSGGSAPSFAGGSPATTAVDNSLKDLFKNDVMPTMPDPKAMFPGMDGGASAQAATGASGEGFSGAEASEGGATGGAQMQGSVPGAFDTRSLFARVHDYHHRCVKKGCVTSEAGGKI